VRSGDHVRAAAAPDAVEEAMPGHTARELERLSGVARSRRHVDAGTDEVDSQTSGEKPAERFVVVRLRPNLMIEMSDGLEPQRTPHVEVVEEEEHRHGIGPAGDSGNDPGIRAPQGVSGSETLDAGVEGHWELRTENEELRTRTKEQELRETEAQNTQSATGPSAYLT
jgi:hypothetical protein